MSALKHRAFDSAPNILAFPFDPSMKAQGQLQQIPTQLERWREVTRWIIEGGSVLVLNEEAAHVNLQTDSLLYDLIEEVQSLAKLENNWDDEGAPVIDRACILRAHNFVKWLAYAAPAREVSHEGVPMLFPTNEGGVKLLWNSQQGRLALVFSPQQDAIEALTKYIGQPSSHKSLSDAEAGEIALQATFLIQKGKIGLSVFRADRATPYEALKARLEEESAKLHSEDESERQKARAWLDKNPDVDTLLKKDYRVVLLPLAEIRAMGFTNIEEPDETGHLNILGSEDDFKTHADEFAELIDTGKARILNPEECRINGLQR
jgi:hypothetical protein